MIMKVLIRALFCCGLLFAGPLVLAEAGQLGKTLTEKEPTEKAYAVLSALALSDIIEVMRQEGLAQAKDVTGGFLPPTAAAAWQRDLDAIYDANWMKATVAAHFIRELGDADMSTVLAFLTSPNGKRLVALEVSARQAMSEASIEDAARSLYRDGGDAPDARRDLVAAFIRSNDMVAANVEGALHASFSYYRGLRESGALEMSDREIIDEVWATEAETRADTSEWLNAFLLMAYAPLDDAVLAEYSALSETGAGQRMNKALFASFDQMFAEIFYALGLTTGQALQAQHL